MEDRIILTFDIGTQSSRAVLVNNHGEILGKKQIQHNPPYSSPMNGWAEQEPEFYYNCICDASQDLKNKYPQIFDKVEAVSITTIRDTVVNLDKEGKPLRPAILWIDGRETEGEPVLSGVSKVIFKAVGLREFVRVQYKKSASNWIAEHQPEIWEKTDRYMLLSGYIAYCLTGNPNDSAASIVGHIPFDVKKRNWAGPKTLTRPLFDVPTEKLSTLVETGKALGQITAKASADTGLKEGLPVISTGSDKACEMIGLGCVKKHQAAISFGTTSTVSFNTPEYLEAEPFLPPYPSIIPGWYNPEYELYRGYWLVSWFKAQFLQDEALRAANEGKSVEQILNEGLGEIKPGCDGLFLSPHFTADISQPCARGGFIGLADYHTKKHMYRALIEGINFALMQGLRTIEQRGKFKFTEIHVGGGGSQSRGICQITADMFGVPVVRTTTHEVSALGSALTAFVGTGVFKGYEEAVSEMVREADRFEPNPENTALYNKLFDIYKKIYPNLKGIYQELAAVGKNQ